MIIRHNHLLSSSESASSKLKKNRSVSPKINIGSQKTSLENPYHRLL